MANTTITTNFAGKAALPYVAPALMAGSTLSKNYIQILQNVAWKANLRVFDGAAIQAADCQFGTPSSGQLTLTDRALVTTQLKVNEQICNKDLRQAWESENMRSAKSASPQELQSAAAKYVAAKIAQQVEKDVWSGNATAAGDNPANNFTGIIKVLQDATITSGNEDSWTGAHSTSNILGRVDALINDAPVGILGNYDETKLYIGPGAHHLLMGAIQAQGSGYYGAEGFANNYHGYEIRICPGLGDSMVFTTETNLYFGTGLLTDHTQASIINMLETTGEDSTRVVFQFTAGTQVVDPNSCSFGYRGS